MCLRCCIWPAPPSEPGAEGPSKAEEAVQPVIKEPISHQPTVTEPITPSGGQQQPQIPAIPKSLPSQVDETLAACPR